MPLDLSGNLLSMKVFDEATRRRLATAFDPRVCTAREYARSVEVSERALRLWRARFLGEQRQAVPARHAAVPLQSLIDMLHGRVADLVAAVDAVQAAVAACRIGLDAAACRPQPSGLEMVDGEGGGAEDLVTGMPVLAALGAQDPSCGRQIHNEPTEPEVPAPLGSDLGGEPGVISEEPAITVPDRQRGRGGFFSDFFVGDTSSRC